MRLTRSAPTTSTSHRMGYRVVEDLTDLQKEL